MFDFQPNPTFAWPVRVVLPQADGGTKEESFTATWQAQPSDELRAFQAAHPKGAVAALLEKALKGWSEINVNGAALPYTPENVAMLADQPFIANALVASYWNALSGALREKN
jgi:hypothetical protein